MVEQTNTGECHRHSVFIAHIDHIVVTDRSTRLCDILYAALVGTFDIVAEREDFLDHIHTCENCREELEIHYMVDVGLKKLDEADGTYDIVGDLKRKVAESYRSLRHISMFQITTYAVSTLTGMALIVMILLQLRIWNTFGFL